MTILIAYLLFVLIVLHSPFLQRLLGAIVLILLIAYAS
jgi:hypothetical protein